MPKQPWFGFQVATPEERGWVPSPGDWVPPDGVRGGRKWVPPGGATERLDRMPWWVRTWSHRPLCVLGGFEDYLWEHGGYDVEGPRATAEREARSVRYEEQQAVIRAALFQADPWPASTTERTQNVEVLDVDRFGGFAVVIAAIEDDAFGVGGPMLNASVFRSDKGGWRSVGGGGSGSGSDPLLRRQQWRDRTKALTTSGTGWGALDGRRGRKGVCHAEVLCSPTVNTVIVDRVGDRRMADVSRGSGWVGLVWLEGQEPTVTALDATGHELGVIPAREFHYDRHNRHLFGRLLRG